MPVSSIYESDAGERGILSLHEESLARLDARHESLSIPTSLGETRVLAVGPGDAPPLLLPDEGFLGREPIRRPTLSPRRTLSGHARRRMRERNVSREDIEHVMSARGRTHSSPRKRSFRGRSLGGVGMEVVYTEDRAEEFHIVTVKIL